MFLLSKKIIHIFHISHQINEQNHVLSLNDDMFDMYNQAIRHCILINNYKIMRKNNAHTEEERKKKHFHNFLQSVQSSKLNAQILVRIFLYYLSYKTSEFHLRNQKIFVFKHNIFVSFFFIFLITTNLTKCDCSFFKFSFKLS